MSTEKLASPQGLHSGFARSSQVRLGNVALLHLVPRVVQEYNMRYRFQRPAPRHRTGVRL